MFLNAMKKSAVPFWRRSVIYAAVRVFGRRAWKSNTDLKKQDPRARFLDRPLDNPFDIKKWRDGYLERGRETPNRRCTRRRRRSIRLTRSGGERRG